MVLSGLALAFSRLIDDSVVVIENVYRHLEMGGTQDSRVKGSERGRAGPFWRSCWSLSLFFFPVTFLFGREQVSFRALALGVVDRPSSLRTLTL